jgi:hypothetical protein
VRQYFRTPSYPVGKTRARGKWRRMLRDELDKTIRAGTTVASNGDWYPCRQYVTHTRDVQIGRRFPAITQLRSDTT